MSGDSGTDFILATIGNHFSYTVAERCHLPHLGFQGFQELFQPVVAEFANLDALSFLDALELVEVTQDTLDDLWKQTDYSPPFLEEGMHHLLEVISSSLGRFVQRKLSNLMCGRDSLLRLGRRFRTAGWSARNGVQLQRC